MPAAAVTPAPLAYIKVAAVKKLVVGSQAWGQWSTFGVTADHRLISCMWSCVLFIGCA